MTQSHGHSAPSPLGGWLRGLAGAGQPHRRLARRRLALALQGGGSFGAFTWGVLDALLGDPAVTLAAASGASAGAVNAVVLAQGLLDGGPEGARQLLARLWDEVAHAARFSPPDGVAHHLSIDLFTQVLSPYQFNPWRFNPLRDLLMALVDFPRLRRERPLRLFLAATRVDTGAARVFREHEVSAEVVLASACLPTLHHAVEIDGIAYWDGGYSANPPILPLVVDGGCDEVLLVQLNPTRHDGLPTSAPGIHARIKRLMFNAPLMHELDLLTAMREQAGRHWWPDPASRRLRRLSLHRLGIDGVDPSLRATSALSARRAFLAVLKGEGERAARTWLEPTRT